MSEPVLTLYQTLTRFEPIVSIPEKQSPRYLEMPEAIPKLTQNAIQQAYLNFEGSRAAIAKRFNVSESTVKRLTKNLRVIRKAKDMVLAEALSQPEPLSSLLFKDGLIDPDAFLLVAIKSVADDLAKTPLKSKEGAIRSLLALIQEHRKQHPRTMDELIDLMLTIPNFDPLVFAHRLKERLQEARG